MSEANSPLLGVLGVHTHRDGDVGEVAVYELLNKALTSRCAVSVLGLTLVRPNGAKVVGPHSDGHKDEV